MDELEYEEAPSITTSSSQSPPAPMLEYEPDVISNVDENTGEDIPVTFSGMSPETAANKTVVSSLDRLKMGFGNLQGNVKYLQGKFEDVKPILDADGVATSELAVLDKDGKWYRVDPVNGELADPWEKTKEYMNDMADLASVGTAIGVSIPITGAVAGGAAAATAMSGGAAAPWLLPAAAVTAAGLSGAATATINSSLGRLVGTYEATPSEQLWDTAFETLLNAGFTGVAAGTKPTATYIANKFPKVAEVFKDSVDVMANSPKALFKKVFAGMSVGENSFDLAVENVNRWKSNMVRIDKAVGGDPIKFLDKANREQVEDIKHIAGMTRKTLTRLYGASKRDVLDKVSDGFQANFDDAIADSYRNALSKNIGKMVTPEGRSLFGVDAVNYLDSKGIKGFKVMNAGEMKQLVNSGKAELADDIGYLSTNPEAHKAVSSFYDEMGSFVNASSRRGKAAADNLLNFKRVMSDKAYDIANSEHISEMSGVKALLDNARASVDDSIVKSLNNAGPGAGQAFQALNAQYSKLQQGFSPLLQAQQRAIKSNSDGAYSTLTNQFLARPRPGAPAREAIDDAIELAKSYRFNDLASELADKKLNIQLLESAKDFNPLKPGTLKGQLIDKGGVGMMGYGVLTGNMALVATGATLKALQSPQTAKLGVALSQGAFKGKQLLQSMPRPQIEKMLSDPRATTAFIDGVVSGPLTRAQAAQDLQDQMMQQEQGQ